MSGTRTDSQRRSWAGTSDDLRLLRLLLRRRTRLERARLHDWDRAVSLEIDLLVALEDAVLTGWAKRQGLA